LQSSAVLSILSVTLIERGEDKIDLGELRDRSLTSPLNVNARVMIALSAGHVVRCLR
jgi:hypothetical protein